MKRRLYRLYWLYSSIIVAQLRAHSSTYSPSTHSALETRSYKPRVCDCSQALNFPSWHHHWSFIMKFNATEQKAIPSRQHFTHKSTHTTHIHSYLHPATSRVLNCVWFFSRCSQQNPQALNSFVCFIYATVLADVEDNRQFTPTSTRGAFIESESSKNSFSNSSFTSN